MAPTEFVRMRLKVVAVLALAIALVVAAKVRPAYALPCNENTQQFFDDSSCSNEVGLRVVTCSGETNYGNTGAQYMIGTTGQCCGNCSPDSCGSQGSTGCIQRW